MNRKKLETAVEWARKSLMQSALMPDIGVLVEAAEAHLATLPKPMWQVKVWIRPVQPPFLFEEVDAVQAGMRAMAFLSDRPAFKIEIEAP